MAAIVPGYEYDIFISYRQKDNGSDKWVTKFVQALNEELESTFKEDISVYFDENPHDGLLETHDVDKSLTEKVKCLVFIPIVSQTYCDPNCFAWQNEFIAFRDFAKLDEHGLDIKLTNGNVIKRILPITIHDIPKADKELFEKVADGKIRGVEFIYKELGVNRPLRKIDNETKNLTGQVYRNQVNKVANALRELIETIKGSEVSSGQSIFAQEVEIPVNSIAVLPFMNMSNDPEQEYFCDGITEEIINTLVQIPDLKVSGRTSAFSFKGKNEDLRIIGDKLNVSKILEGSIRKSGNHIRISAQLVDCQNGFHIWSDKFDEELSDIFEIQDRIALAIIDKLKVSLGADRAKTINSYTSDPELYNNYLLAKFYFNHRTPEGFEKAIEILKSIVDEDPEFAPAYATMADCFRLNLFGYGTIPREEALNNLRKYSKQALKINPNLDAVHASLGHTAMLVEWDLKKSEFHLSTALKINPNNLEALQWFGWYYTATEKFEKASFHFKRALEIDPLSAVLTTEAGWPYNYAGDLDKAAEYYKRAIEIDSNYALAYFDLGNVYVNQGNAEEGFELMEKAIEQWGHVGFFLGTYSHMQARFGKPEKVEECLKMLLDQHEQGMTVAFAIADVYEGMGDTDQTLKWLHIAYDQNELMLPFARLWRSGHLQSSLLEGNEEFDKLMNKVWSK